MVEEEEGEKEEEEEEKEKQQRKNKAMNCRKSVRWSAVPLPCLGRS